MFRKAFALAAVAILSMPAVAPTPANAGGHNCQTVRFPSGAYAHTVHGVSNSAQAQCYSLAVRPGQRARVRITYGPAYFSTSHTNGGFTDVEFITRNGQLFVFVDSHYDRQSYGIEFVFL